MTIHAQKRRQRKIARRTRVWLNGREVTKRCFYVDARRGVVRLYLEDFRGQKLLHPDGDRVVTYERRGCVLVRVNREARG